MTKVGLRLLIPWHKFIVVNFNTSYSSAEVLNLNSSQNLKVSKRVEYVQMGCRHLYLKPCTKH